MHTYYCRNTISYTPVPFDRKPHHSPHLYSLFLNYITDKKLNLLRVRFLWITVELYKKIAAEQIARRHTVYFIKLKFAAHWNHSQ